MSSIQHSSDIPTDDQHIVLEDYLGAGVVIRTGGRVHVWADNTAMTLEEANRLRSALQEACSRATRGTELAEAMCSTCGHVRQVNPKFIPLGGSRELVCEVCAEARNHCRLQVDPSPCSRERANDKASEQLAQKMQRIDATEAMFGALGVRVTRDICIGKGFGVQWFAERKRGEAARYFVELLADLTVDEQLAALAQAWKSLSPAQDARWVTLPWLQDAEDPHVEWMGWGVRRESLSEGKA